MKTSFLFVAVLAFAATGCKKKAGETAATGGDCAKAINNSMALSKAEMEKQPGVDAAMMQKMADLGIKRCSEDKWSTDAIKCMTDAKSMTDAQGCYGKLTPEQQTKMNNAAMEMAMGSAGSGSDSGSAGSAAAGSDAAGSAAGSGSAAAGSGSAGSAAATGSGSAGSAAAPQ